VNNFGFSPVNHLRRDPSPLAPAASNLSLSALQGGVERLQRFADEARNVADQAEPGRKKDEPIEKARRAEATAGAANRLKA
jgi:hypothetical protein